MIARHLTRRGLHSVAAAVISQGRVVYETAQGVRRAGDPTPVSVRDPYHIGSDTKAMTALLAGMLVDEGKLSWGSRVGDLLGAEAAGAYAAVRLDQLLSHTSGMPALPPRDAWLGYFGTDRPPEQERDSLARVCLKLPLLWEPGTALRYSNFGYVVAGRMIEILAQTSWEDLVRDRLFRALGARAQARRPRRRGRG